MNSPNLRQCERVERIAAADHDELLAVQLIRDRCVSDSSDRSSATALFHHSFEVP